MAATQFRCEGRRYPNGPVVSILGCQGRVPPRIWNVNIDGLSGQAEHLNGRHACYWDRTINTIPFLNQTTQVSGQWVREPSIANQGASVIVRTLFTKGRWTLKVEIRKNFIGLQPGSQLWYELAFIPGFPADWRPERHTLNHWWTVGQWLGGFPEVCQITNGFYGSIPADTCILP